MIAITAFCAIIGALVGSLLGAQLRHFDRSAPGAGALIGCVLGAMAARVLVVLFVVLVPMTIVLYFVGPRLFWSIKTRLLTSPTNKHIDSEYLRQADEDLRKYLAIIDTLDGLDADQRKIMKEDAQNKMRAAVKRHADSVFLPDEKT